MFKLFALFNNIGRFLRNITIKSTPIRDKIAISCI